MKTRNGYLNEGKVLLGLAVCHKGNFSDCKRCPYNRIGVGCGSRLTADALRYIIELEMKVADYEEKEFKS